MKVIAIIFLVSFFFLAEKSANQTENKKASIFITKNLIYLQFINDSMLCTSIGGHDYPTHYYIQSDSLFMLNEYFIMNMKGTNTHFKEWKSYKLIQQNNDSITLQTTYKKSNDSALSLWKHTFFNLENEKEPIFNFKYLKFTYTGYFKDTQKIFIDSAGKVLFETIPGIRQEKRILQKATHKFTKIEFQNFLDTLSYSLPSRLPEKRFGCGSRPSYINLEIKYNDSIITSEGCRLSWIHEHFLFSYLMSLNKNEGLTKPKRK